MSNIDRTFKKCYNDSKLQNNVDCVVIQPNKNRRTAGRTDLENSKLSMGALCVNKSS